MAKYINADELIDRIERMWDTHQLTNSKCKTFVNLLNAEPSADVVEVVRCRDCKHSAPNGVYGCTLERFSAHDKSERLYSEDYCSCGERKDG